VLGGLFTAIIGLAVMLTHSAQAHDLEHVGDDRIHPILKIGAHAPAFNLPGVDGKMHNMEEYAASTLLVVIFVASAGLSVPVLVRKIVLRRRSLISPGSLHQKHQTSKIVR
jgi:hypothetical protein